MRAIFFDTTLKYRTDYPIPQSGEKEALIKVTRAGICNTDLEITKGYMRFKGVPGHEFVGIVEKCSDRTLEGKRVVGEINLGCNKCVYCLKGLQNHCPSRSVLGILNREGVFADYLSLPIKNLHVIPDSVSDDEAVFIEPLAAAFEILEQVTIRPSDRVCVLGDGKLGLLVAQVISMTGCNIVAAGRHQEKLSVLEQMGIETRLSSEMMEREFDYIVECTGSVSGLGSAMKLIRPAGTIILKTTAADREEMDLNSVVIDEVSLVGSRCGPFAPALRALEKRYVEVKPLISRIFPLEEGVEAFRYASEKGVLKVLLKM